MWLLQTMSHFNYASFCNTKHMQTSPLLPSGMWHSADLGQYFSPTWWFHSYAHSISSLVWNVGTYLSNHMVSHTEATTRTTPVNFTDPLSSLPFKCPDLGGTWKYLYFLYSDLFCKKLLRECPYIYFIIQFRQHNIKVKVTATCFDLTSHLQAYRRTKTNYNMHMHI